VGWKIVRAAVDPAVAATAGEADEQVRVACRLLCAAPNPNPNPNLSPNLGPNPNPNPSLGCSVWGLNHSPPVRGVAKSQTRSALR